MVFGEPIDQVWGEFMAFIESNIVYGFCLAGLCGEPGGHPKPKTKDLQAGSAGCRWFVLSQQSKCHNPLLSRKYHILLFFFLRCINTIDGFAMFAVSSFLVSLGWGTSILKEPCKQHLPQLYRTLRPYLPAEPSWLRWWELCGWGQKKYSSAPFHFGNFVIRWMQCFAFWVEMVHELETQPTGSWPWKTAAVSMSFMSFMSFMTIDVLWGGRDTCCSVLWQQMLLHPLMRRGVFHRSPQTQFLAVSGRTFQNEWLRAITRALWGLSNLTSFFSCSDVQTVAVSV